MLDAHPGHLGRPGVYKDQQRLVCSLVPELGCLGRPRHDKHRAWLPVTCQSCLPATLAVCHCLSPSPFGQPTSSPRLATKSLLWLYPDNCCLLHAGSRFNIPSDDWGNMFWLQTRCPACTAPALRHPTTTCVDRFSSSPTRNTRNFALTSRGLGHPTTINRFHDKASSTAPIFQWFQYYDYANVLIPPLRPLSRPRRPQPGPATRPPTQGCGSVGP